MCEVKVESSQSTTRKQSLVEITLHFASGRVMKMKASTIKQQLMTFSLSVLARLESPPPIDLSLAPWRKVYCSLIKETDGATLLTLTLLSKTNSLLRTYFMGVIFDFISL